MADKAKLTHILYSCVTVLYKSYMRKSAPFLCLGLNAVKNCREVKNPTLH
jgi:hypothetical protein